MRSSSVKRVRMESAAERLLSWVAHVLFELAAMQVVVSALAHPEQARVCDVYSSPLKRYLQQTSSSSSKKEKDLWRI